ncbi:TPA: translation elongation factor Ts [Candidatus Gracilibacteria bacterium]|nr:translation elongation factor Ts [Candidatus Gracilibacteria bacterium]HIQ57610.1 translation elongation factor Ts [Candidatus Gracilibacteria bacterium]
MANISAQSVMALRKKTGVSMMECKKALVEAEGNEEQAITILKEKGSAKAAKKSDRETGEGVAFFKGNAYLELLCETDFVARNDDFKTFANEILVITNEKGIDAGKEFFEAEKVEKITQLGENLVLRDLGILEGEIVSGYIHSDGKTTGIVALSGGDAELAKDIGMHIVGLKPSVISYKDIDSAAADEETAGRIAAVKEENIERGRLGKPLLNIPQFISQSQITDEILKNIEAKMKKELIAEGKPEAILDKILPGKIERFIKDNTSFDKEQALLSQDFVKDPSITIEKLLASKGATITGFKLLLI